jgi:hypothetical protein
MDVCRYRYGSGFPPGRLHAGGELPAGGAAAGGASSDGKEESKKGGGKAASKASAADELRKAVRCVARCSNLAVSRHYVMLAPAQRRVALLHRAGASVVTGTRATRGT